MPVRPVNRSFYVFRILSCLAVVLLLCHLAGRGAMADLLAPYESDSVQLQDGLSLQQNSSDDPAGDEEPTYKRRPQKPKQPKQQQPRPPQKNAGQQEQGGTAAGQPDRQTKAGSAQQNATLPAVTRGGERTYHVISRVVRTDNSFGHNGGRLKVVIVMPIPASGEFQRVENVRYSAGTVVSGPASPNRFLRVEAPEPPAEITLEFDVTISSLAADFSRITGTRPYDRNSQLYRTFTAAGGPLIQPDHPAIKAMVEEIGGTALEPLEFARRAYLFQQQRFKHLGRSYGPAMEDTLRAGGGACGELSSLYISLLRSRGIPARYNLGGMLRDNGEWGPHAWPDFYLEGYGWIPADPSVFIPNGGAFGKRGDGYLIMGTDEGKVGVNTGSKVDSIGPVQHYSYWYWISGGSAFGSLTYRHELTTVSVK